MSPCLAPPRNSSVALAMLLEQMGSGGESIWKGSWRSSTGSLQGPELVASLDLIPGAMGALLSRGKLCQGFQF